MNWHEIKDSQSEKQFYYEGQPIFKKFKSILKFHEPGLAPVEDDSGWYHIDTRGNPIYTERYKRVFGFYCGLAAVTDKNLNCFHIDIMGKRVYPDNYIWVGNYQENICTVRTLNNKYYHIDLKGEKLINETEYIYAGDFRDGIAVVMTDNKLCRHVNNNGEFINDKSFLDLGVFHKNIAPARDENGWFHIDVNGIQLYSQRYNAIEPFYNGFALVEDFNHSKKIINEKGDVILCL